MDSLVLPSCSTEKNMESFRTSQGGVINMQNPFEARGELVTRWINDRQSLLRRETEDHLRNVILDYKSRSATYWHRDYSSIDAYQRSVEPNRGRWHETIGVFDADATPPNPVLDLWYKDDRFTAWWVTIDLLGTLRGRAIFALPNGQPGPLPFGNRSTRCRRRARTGLWPE